MVLLLYFYYLKFLEEHGTNTMVYEYHNQVITSYHDFTMIQILLYNAKVTIVRFV